MRKDILINLETEFSDKTNYREEYIKLIKGAKNSKIEGYYEKHHILPVSIFPKWKNRKSNLINLTLEDHYRAHFLLYKIYNDYKMTAAFLFMLKTSGWKYNPKIFKEVREKYISYLNKPVYCYELNKVFKSISIAASNIKKSMSGLANVCRNKQFTKTTGGFHWCCLEDKEEAIDFWKNNLVYKNKPVYCYELNKDFISSAEASKNILSHLKETHISEICRNKQFTKTAGDFHWCFVKDKEEAVLFWKNNILKIGKNKPVYCYELNKDFISSTEAIKFLQKCKRGDITNRCKNKQFTRTVGGFHWCYLEDKEEAINFWKKII